MKLDNSVYYTPAKPSDTCNRNIQGKNSLAPEIMTEVFEIKEPHYNLRSEATIIHKMFGANSSFYVK